MIENPKTYYSLLELTSSIESVIKKTYSKSYWVKAEIAKLNYYPKSGHCYPDLVEKENGVILTQIRATIWAGQFTEINTKFLKIAKEPISDGMTVLIRTTVNFHPLYGMGLQIIDIEPSFTLGELAKERLQSIERLKSEGIFDKNKQLSAALILQRIAVISVETSKGYHDFVKIIEKNEWGYSIFHMLFPALLQGKGAVFSIKEQLTKIRRARQFFDAVVIIRGGGGDIGLSSYDNYELAKAVALYPLPIITGIGHATNETVVELVSYENKITPTDVGYYLIQKFHNFLVRLQSARDLLVKNSVAKTENERKMLSENGKVIATNIDKLLVSITHKLSMASFKLNQSLLSYNDKKRNVLDIINNKLAVSVNSYAKSNKQKLDSLNEKLKLLDPKNVLKRGYTITTINSEAVVSTTGLNTDDIVKTQTYDGRFTSKIKSIDKSKK